MELEPPATRVGQQHFHLEVTTESGIYSPHNHPDLNFEMPVYTIIFEDAAKAFDAWNNVTCKHLARFLGDPADLHAEESAEIRERWLSDTNVADEDETYGASIDGGAGMEYHLYVCYGCTNVTDN
jgi:hypothetical protein